MQYTGLASTLLIMELQDGDSTNIQNQIPIYHHDRNHSLPSTAYHNESLISPINGMPTRSATVSKTENLKQIALNTAITPGSLGPATAPVHADLQEQFTYPPANSTGIQSAPAVTTGEIQLPDPSFMGVDMNIVNNMHQPYHGGPNITQSASVSMPMVDLNPATLTIPDLQSANMTGYPQQISIPQPAAPYEPGRPTQNTSQHQTTSPLTNEGKNPSEYALHIIFTQVRKNSSPYYYMFLVYSYIYFAFIKAVR